MEVFGGRFGCSLDMLWRCLEGVLDEFCFFSRCVFGGVYGVVAFLSCFWSCFGGVYGGVYGGVVGSCFGGVYGGVAHMLCRCSDGFLDYVLDPFCIFWKVVWRFLA